MMRSVTRGAVWLAAVVVVLVAAGCGGGDGGGTAATSDSGPSSTAVTDHGAAAAGALEGRWLLQESAVDGVLKPLPADVSANMTFTADEVNGRGPMNLFFGSYTSDGDVSGALSFSELGSTEMSGTPVQQTAEERFFENLRATRAYAITGDRLVLSDGAGVDRLTFVSVDSTVVGEWKVTGFNDGRQAVVSPVSGSELTVEFLADGTLTGFGGVNRFVTRYTSEAAANSELTLTVEPPAGTMKGGDPELMRQEGEFLAALESATRVTFDGDALTLRTADDQIALTLSPK